MKYLRRRIIEDHKRKGKDKKAVAERQSKPLGRTPLRPQDLKHRLKSLLFQKSGSMASTDRRSSLRRLSTIDKAQLQLNDPPTDLTRHFSFIGMLGLAFAILNSWTALAASLSLALPSGGSTSVLWGLITAGICNLALAASLAEFLSSYPTA